MRTSDSLLLIGFLISMLAGCGSGEQADGSADQAIERPGSLPMTAGGSAAQAPYGVVADVRFQGNVAELDAGAKVYVYLRAAGERMPLAVQYFDAGDLPRRVTFMTPQPHSNVELVARLSYSGRVEASPGDPQVILALAEVGHPPATVELVLGAAMSTSRSSESAAIGQAAKTDEPDTRPPVAVQVLVSAEGVQDYPADSVVFVVARQPGTPMPLAVKRLQLSDLPAQIVLSDADAMMFTHRLSSVDAFTLMARISPTGDTARSEGEPQSELLKIDTAEMPERVELKIIGAG